ncbi:MAG TPA: hypothetical protein VH540_20855 [Ktedonobacterales bacterium]|jgi:hypothetical protein
MIKQQQRGNIRQPLSRLLGWTRREVRVWPLAVGLAVVLFPFDWLADVWPLFRQAFDVVFVTARDHAIGHTTMFFLLGLLVLLSLPLLSLRPRWYVGGIVLVAFCQEALQDLSRQRPPNIWEGRDMLFDLAGALLAFGVIWLWRVVSQRYFS